MKEPHVWLNILHFLGISIRNSPDPISTSKLYLQEISSNKKMKVKPQCTGLLTKAGINENAFRIYVEEAEIDLNSDLFLMRDSFINHLLSRCEIAA